MRMRWTLVGSLVLLGVLVTVLVSTTTSQDHPGGLGSADVNPGAPEQADLPENVVVEPEGGQLVLVNELAILASGHDVSAIVAGLGGEITIAVPKTDTYQARFAVSSLAELDAIAAKLEQRGLRAQYVIVMVSISP